MFGVSTTVSIFVAVFRNGKSNYPLHSFRPKGTINSTSSIGKMGSNTLYQFNFKSHLQRMFYHFGKNLQIVRNEKYDVLFTNDCSTVQIEVL